MGELRRCVEFVFEKSKSILALYVYYHNDGIVTYNVVLPQSSVAAFHFDPKTYRENKALLDTLRDLAKQMIDNNHKCDMFMAAWEDTLRGI